MPKTADRIAVLADLTLRPNHEGRLRTRLRQAAVGVRHIRLG
ncbi:TmrB OS=Streptomyces albaduncus OX=68172 GN=FHS32_005343 PE=4 SV=1 [Streptomyces griseoloalbus]